MDRVAKFTKLNEVAVDEGWPGGGGRKGKNVTNCRASDVARDEPLSVSSRCTVVASYSSNIWPPRCENIAANRFSDTGEREREQK